MRTGACTHGPDCDCDLNYCPLCEHYARASEKLNDENRALREGNTRLRAERDQHADVAQMEVAARADRDEIRRLREENARLRTDTKRMEECAFAWKAEVKRLEGLIVRYGGSDIQAELRRTRGEKP